MIITTFVISPRADWREALMLTSSAQKSIMASLLPEKYRTLFKSLVKDSVNEIMDNRDHQKAYAVMAEAMLTGHGELWYPSNGTEPLQQLIRKTFYDTLLIVANDYNPYSYDYFIVVLSQEVISESQFEGTQYRKHTHNGPSNGKIVIGNFTRTA